jgi:hypothetical protein
LSPAHILVDEDQQRLRHVRIEPADEVLALADGDVVFAEQPPHGTCKEAFPAAFATTQHQRDAAFLFRPLHHVGQPWPVPRLKALRMVLPMPTRSSPLYCAASRKRSRA